MLADPPLPGRTVEFSRRVLAVSPGSTVVFFGTEEPRAAAAAIAAGARAVIRVDTADPVATLAKAVLLVLPVGRTATRSPARVGTRRPAGGASGGPGTARRREDRGRDGRRAVAAPACRAARRGPRRPPRRGVELTERELQVLRGMADGKSNAEIGRELFVSEDTVKTHARRLFRKLGARDRAHAVAAAFRAGMVSERSEHPLGTPPAANLTGARLSLVVVRRTRSASWTPSA